VHRQRFGRLARLGRAAPMKAHAERLFLHQAARPGARQRVEIAGHVFQHRRSLGPRPDIVPAIFQPMAAGHRQGLGNRPENAVDLFQRAAADHSQAPVHALREILEQCARVCIGAHRLGRRPDPAACHRYREKRSPRPAGQFAARAARRAWSRSGNGALLCLASVWLVRVGWQRAGPRGATAALPNARNALWFPQWAVFWRQVAVLYDVNYRRRSG
jgi:hypothetical protein